MSSSTNPENIVENFDWSQLSLEQLKLVQSQVGKAISLKKQNLKLTKDTTNISKNYGYKATLAKVFPHSLRNCLSGHQKCIFAISLGSKNFVYRERLEACIKLISENFQTCLVLVGDSVHRLTIEVRQGIEGDDAWLQAIRTGEKFVNENSFLFEQYSENCQFEFKMASEIEKRSDYNIYYEELQSLYQENRSFQTMVNSFAQKYLNRGEEVVTEQLGEVRQKYLATTYLLEESALFTCLVKQGWLVFVYPGSIKTFEEISEGLHPEVPEPLKQMIWASLRLKRLNAKKSEQETGGE
ncbi:MAG: tRNA-dependent cyclodipeptide synthase [Okeania sp. SIO3I5]|uniref:tRNA-dependent cyclodipeptide synthase n=1 Tax=Okeania sp. SIO3I5 TaxID=2607805 RepID=UPI0013BC209A|nr:tRNA-dependent cyclodipeptide synthase [Okeania sp. SIO3I5]NEQ37460.1 tRNA-dependent cyclodipeptide synthase [Okeania sp. SIO3I5]